MSDLTIISNRKVTIYDSSSGFHKVYETSTNKWSDIVTLLENDGFSMSGKEAVLSSTRGHLVLPDAEIPAGDQRIFTVQSKMKSGASSSTNFKDMQYYDLLRLCKAEGITTGSSPSKTLLVNLLTDKSKIKSTKSIKAKKEIVKTVKEKAITLRPDLEERITVMETLLGDFFLAFKEAFNKIPVVNTVNAPIDLQPQISIKTKEQEDKKALDKEADEIRKALGL